MTSKSEIRREGRSGRNSLDTESGAVAADNIRTQLLALNVIRGANTWFVYVSSGSEVDTHELIHTLLKQDCTVAVPRVVGPETMIARQIHAWEELHLAEFGILAPPPGEPFASAIDVCICPGVAFTERGERLGSGRGFYDRWLAVHSPRLAIGLAFECQMVAELPLELHDRRMDYVITEKRVLQISP